MNDSLQSVWISLGKVTKDIFFENIKKIVSNSFPDVFSKTAGKWQILEFQIPNTPHKGLTGQLIDKNQNDNKIYLRIRASKWSPIEPLTYETYVNTINAIFKPLIKRYSKTYKSRFKIYIPQKESLEEQLPPTLQLLFNNFVNRANASLSYQNDWKEFYPFVRACHYHRKKAYIKWLLVSAGFSEEDASELQIAFDHGYGVLDTPIPRLAMSLSSYYANIVHNDIMDNVKKSYFGKISLEDVKAKRSKKNEIILTLEGRAKNIEIKKEFLKDLEWRLNTTAQTVKIKDNIEIL